MFRAPGDPRAFPQFLDRVPAFRFGLAFFFVREFVALVQVLMVLPEKSGRMYRRLKFWL